MAIRLLMRKTYTILSPPSETIVLWVYPKLDNYMMDKVCELNPMLTKSHTPHKDVFFMHKRVGIWSDNQPITDRDEWQT